MAASRNGDLAQRVELVAGIGAPAVEAYTRLRMAEQLVQSGRAGDVHGHLAPALACFTKVGATLYLAQAEELLSAST